MPSVSVKDVNQQVYVKALARFFKKSGKVKQPEWVDLVKTGKMKELAPFDPDWYFVRVAATARHIYVRNPVGVGSLKKIFGGRERRGTRPNHFVKGSGSLARKTLQTLESLKLIEKTPNGGRSLTSQGHRDLDRIATQIKAVTRKAKARRKPKVLNIAAKKPAAPKPVVVEAAPKAEKPAKKGKPAKK